MLVPHRRRQHFLKNEVSAWIWSRIEEERTLWEILEDLMERYDVPAEQAERDLLELCRKLVSEEALEISGNA